MADMDHVAVILEGFAESKNSPAIAWRGDLYDYGALLDTLEEQSAWLDKQAVGAGHVCILLGDFSPVCVALLLALIQKHAVVVPLAPATYSSLSGIMGEVSPEFLIDATQAAPTITRLPGGEGCSYYETLRLRDVPGLVLFTSGSTGKPKAVVHDFPRLLKKFHTSRDALITLNFLLFDHWGGLNTLLHGLSNQSLVVFPENRTPEAVCKLIEQYRVELLPATPSFLNLFLISKAYDKYDLGSLRLITYGAEPMPESTLRGLRRAIPDVDLRQTYGMIEIGVLRAKSKSSDSLWVKIGGEGYDVRVVDGILQIKADAAMLGYINAPTPMTEDGYLITGDVVEQDGEYLRILGRDTDIINVGGQKVYPVEIETQLLEMPEIEDVAVYGEKNFLTGMIVCADIVARDRGDDKLFKAKIKAFCREKMQPYMIPVKINFSDTALQSARMKRKRPTG